MLYRVLLQLFLIFAAFAFVVSAQSDGAGSVTKGEIRRVLEANQDSDALIAKANADLVAAIQKRGVDFVLTPEEEWAFELRDASPKLLEAIRNAIDPGEREVRLKTAKQEELYNSFASNYSRSDLDSRRIALNAGREFVSLYSADSKVSQIVSFMQRTIPSLERSIQMLERREEMMQRARERNFRNAERQRNNRSRTVNGTASGTPVNTGVTRTNSTQTEASKYPNGANGPPKDDSRSPNPGNTPPVIVVYPPGTNPKPIDN